MNDYKFCNNCGEKLAQDAEFCPKCGTKQIVAKKETATAETTENESQSEAADGTNTNWHPYNQYEKDIFNKSTLIATRDIFKLNRCVGKATFWYAYLYIMLFTIISYFISPGIAVGVSIVCDLVMLSLVIRRANDSIADSTLRMTVIVAFAITMIGDVAVAYAIVASLLQLVIILFVGLRKTDWSTKYERPIGDVKSTN